jgi:hypothetical protein
MQVLATEYHIALGNPWSSYGETVIVAVQSVLILFFIWSYAWPGYAEVVIVLTALVASTVGAYLGGPDAQYTVQMISTALFASARGIQVVANYRQVSPATGADLPSAWLTPTLCPL